MTTDFDVTSYSFNIVLIIKLIFKDINKSTSQILITISLSKITLKVLKESGFSVAVKIYIE